MRDSVFASHEPVAPDGSAEIALANKYPSSLNDESVEPGRDVSRRIHRCIHETDNREAEASSESLKDVVGPEDCPRAPLGADSAIAKSRSTLTHAQSFSRGVADLPRAPDVLTRQNF